MTVAASTKPVASPPERVMPVPQFFDTGLIVTPSDNPPCNPAIIATLTESMREHGQLVPGWLCPSEELPDDQRECLEGNHRLGACRQLGIPFWAFDCGRFVPEEERIRLTFQHNHSRRVMTREEIAERAARYMELTGSPAFDAARMLGISGPTLSRALGERRIPVALKPRTDPLNLSVRSLIAAAPPTLMERAIAFAETPMPDGKAPTRDQVAAYIRQLKQDQGKPNRKKLKQVPLKVGGRIVSIGLAEGDNTASVTKDLNAIIARLARHPDMQPDGWPFLFQ